MDVSRELTDTEAKILFSLAKAKEKSYSTLLKERLAGSNKTLLRSLNNLDPKKLNLINYRKGENEKPVVVGRKTTYYRLNLFGLLRLFYHFRKDENKLLKIFQKKNAKSLGSESVPLIVDMFKEDIPLVFGQWNYFQKKNLEDIAEKHFVNNLNYCSSSYQRSLESMGEVKEHKKEHVPLIRALHEKWKKEKYWTKVFTGVFLHYSFKTDFCVKNHFVPLIPLSSDELPKLKYAIQKNDQMHLYCLKLSREDAHSYTLNEPNRWDSTLALLWDPFTVQRKISNILTIKMLKYAGDQDPLYKIADAALNEDWFSVAFELCKLYQNYTFTSEKEAWNAIVWYTQFLAERKVFDIGTSVMKKQTENKQLPKDVVKQLKSVKLQTFAATYFFSLYPVKVWDKNFYQLTLNEERLKQFEENRKEAMAEAVIFAHKLFNLGKSIKTNPSLLEPLKASKDKCNFS
jgi:hypothetical protein